jgi:hypothetical protein
LKVPRSLHVTLRLDPVVSNVTSSALVQPEGVISFGLISGVPSSAKKLTSAMTGVPISVPRSSPSWYVSMTAY